MMTPVCVNSSEEEDTTGDPEKAVVNPENSCRHISEYMDLMSSISSDSLNEGLDIVEETLRDGGR